jgi:hypothetical protein
MSTENHVLSGIYSGFTRNVFIFARKTEMTWKYDSNCGNGNENGSMFFVCILKIPFLDMPAFPCFGRATWILKILFSVYVFVIYPFILIYFRVSVYLDHSRLWLSHLLSTKMRCGRSGRSAPVGRTVRARAE